MGEKEKNKNKNNNKKQKHQHPNSQTTKQTSDFSFKPTSEVKEAMKCSVDRIWPHEIALGDVNKKLIKGLVGFEMARFKFRKGCLTFYVYAVREIGSFGFLCAEDLKIILQSVVELKDFLDHTTMLAMPNQRSINYSQSQQNQVAMAH
ncbi:hypothetical protein L195_g030466 [Trifolium pratense]|uniref:DUF7851 domain-containing protein n=1 Tax=Trifolium pratense TaxID=57577 RepID=A0A2K3L7M9_TRIPR|nr:hypothetical protein L195_g030466 [Trifolium pratense]